MLRAVKISKSMHHMLIRKTKYAIRISFCVFFVFFILTGCAQATPTPFVPPFPATQPPTEAVSVSFLTPTPPILTPEYSPTPRPSSPPAATAIPNLPSPTPPCTDDLKFIEDVTVPDNTVFFVAQPIVKQWRVENTGSCNWDDRYRLKLVSGEALGAPAETALFPAQAGSQVVLEIDFTAPLEPNTYITAWQAYDPEGQPFGETIYMQVIVQLP